MISIHLSPQLWPSTLAQWCGPLKPSIMPFEMGSKNTSALDMMRALESSWCQGFIGTSTIMVILATKPHELGKKKTRRLARNLIALLRNVGILLELHKLQETSSNQAQIKHESGRSLWQNMRQELRWTMVKMKICTCLPCQQISKHRCASGVRQNPVTIQPSSGLEPLNFPQFEGDP